MSYRDANHLKSTFQRNFGVKRGLGCWKGRKRFGMEGCPMKHRRSIQSSPGVLLWANDLVLSRYKVRYSVSTNA
ncbi:MAG: hypothetical protein CM15mP39_10910 [Synechococcus sp.]|nr:MAG: hypothetical protein CM15mP39_10910 [Synechococcus sp.]